MAEGIIQIGERLKNAQIECRPAVELIKGYNAKDCLIYADPPYLEGTRRSRIYRKEMMKREEHEEMLTALLNHTGPVMISGYDNDLYNSMLAGWHKEEKQGRANSTAVRTETVWMNYDPPNAQMSWVDFAT